MILSEVIKNIKILNIIGNTDIAVTGIEFDSRKVVKGNVFIAVTGYNSDGHNYIESAAKRGALAIVCEHLPEKADNNIVYILVKDSAESLGIIASSFYNNPSENIKLIGITGTNGKTTTATLLYKLFELLGYKTGLLSTIRNYIHTTAIEATHTTPDPVQLNKLLAHMVNTGCDYCFMEVSSHALHQKRVAGIKFTGAVFTNITQDHLDYHKTFAEYIKAKKLLFDNLNKNAFALVNIDDRNGKIMLQNTKAKKYTMAQKSIADFKVKLVEADINGMMLTFDNTEVWTKFIGKFNAYNLLSVYAVAVLLNQKRDEILNTLSSLSSVDGRFQYIKSKSGKLAIIDYAHTPDALENVLKTINEIKENGKIITVVGAGGNRDKTKRPVMANICAKLSDKVILTSDNPRNEKPDDIINDMKTGVLPPLNNKLVVITKRDEAIRAACMFASSGDIILVAGKGHETYQEIEGIKHPFNDIEIVTQVFDNE
jgi:UDP-N-acetylmuramoyl-L-alanyl-D-glutamate--2,6-diaminopimelate ligase